ncbi:hypothetical protein BGZ68_006381 [Mortierella alpina]|nr:hypothetical protein BGZ68_006381 [Mortierella alpina]
MTLKDQAAVTSAAGQAAPTLTLSWSASPVTRSTCSSAPQYPRKCITARHSRFTATWFVGTAATLLVFSATVISAQMTIAGVAAAYDPLEPASNQLMVPVMAGGPPPPSTAIGQARQRQKEQAYLQRLEKNRALRRGQFYVEISRKEATEESDDDIPRVDGVTGGTETSKEPLPWEGIEDEDDDEDNRIELDQDDFLSKVWGISPWKDSFKFRAEDRSQDDDNDTASERHVWNMESEPRPVAPSDNNDDGAAVVEDQDSDRAEFVSSTVDGDLESEKETGRLLKVEEEGRFGTESNARDPNVREYENEIIVPQVWDADGVSQKGETGKQEYVETEEETVDEPPTLPLNDTQSNKDEEGERGGKDVRKARLDQVDLMGGEAELDWLQNQAAIPDALEAKHHHHQQEQQHLQDGGLALEYTPTAGDEIDPDVTTPTCDTQTFEEMFEDPLWGYKHGGLNPKHYRDDNTQHADFPPQCHLRLEEQDRDEDGTVFPDADSTQPYSKIVFPSDPADPESPLGYIAYNHQGDRIMDFSMAGWNEGNTELPDPLLDVPVIERLEPRPEADSDDDKGDDTPRIQKAIRRALKLTGASMNASTVVPTGALVLARGVYRIRKPLQISGSGLLFRGDSKGGSRIVCQWAPNDFQYAIEVEGNDDEILDSTRIPIVADYSPVGSFFLNLDPARLLHSDLDVGDQVIVSRVGNDRWIEYIGMDDFNTQKEGVRHWKRMRARMFRTIRSLNRQTGVVQMDAPLPISIERRFGGGWITQYNDNKVRALGIQFLDMVFPQNIGRAPNDMLDDEGRGSEDYRFSYGIFTNYALRLDNVCHMYLSHITTAFFHNFVSVGAGAHHLTMDSIVHSYPDELYSGQSAFQLSGQLMRIQNSVTQGSFHYVVHISHVMGPNVIHRVQALNVGKPFQPMPLDFAPGDVGPHMKFCTGLLYDQVVTDGTIQIVNRGDIGSGQGLSGANSVIWNSRAREGVLTHRTRGFQNFVIGSEDFEAYDRMPWSAHGWKEHLGSEVLPGSLYLRQLADRRARLAKGWVA